MYRQDQGEFGFIFNYQVRASLYQYMSVNMDTDSSYKM